MATRIRAPELPPGKTWLNCDRALSLSDLKGRIILLDFWSYCCINCFHVLSELKYIEKKHASHLTVIGVHSAKFDNEKQVENVRQAVLRYDIEHPVVVDSDFDIWQRYGVRVWPTLVLIDPEGYALGYLSGEGHRDALDELIAQMVVAHDTLGTIDAQVLRFPLEKDASKPTPLAFPGKVLAVDRGLEGQPCLFVADSGHHRIVAIALEGKILEVVGSGLAGLTDGSFERACFANPQGIAFDPSERCLYVADTNNHALRCINFRRKTVTTVAGTGEQSNNLLPHCGPALKTALNSPWDLALADGKLYVAMAGNHQIWSLDLEREDICSYAGIGRESCTDGNLREAAFAQPNGIAAGAGEAFPQSRRTLFVADSETSALRCCDREKVRTVCGSGDLFGFGDRDGTGSDVLLQHCTGVAWGNGRLWVADTYNHRIKCVDPQSGECHSVFGNGRRGDRDGAGTEAQFSEPSGLSVLGNFLYVADTNNHRIRRANLSDNSVSTLELSGLPAVRACVPV